MPLRPAGKRDRRITFQKLVETQSDSGAVIYVPQNVATVWAEKVPDRGMEAFREAQIQAWSTVIWRALYFLDVLAEPTVKWQILEGTRVYDVLEVRELNRRDGWEFVTRARAEDQAA